jgi:L-ascorbate metabolism protein UlaG (beta-lactamase superfamily)
VRITWIGHSTVLLELDGVRLLTDPLLRRQLFHVRRVASGPDTSGLGDLDAVLVSHVHYDHLDLRSLRRLGGTPRFVVPAGAGAVLRGRGLGRVEEVDAGDTVDVGAVTVRATHAEHEASRAFGGTVPAVGFVIEGSRSVYFAGDTDVFDAMSDLAANLDVALLPVAGWGPRIPEGHLDPLRAAKALRLLRPRVAVPVHWGTYLRLGMPRDPAILREPAESFVRHARELAPEVDVLVLPVGGRLELPGTSGSAARATVESARP